MINIEYKKSCTEVLEILKHISKKDYQKIPSDIIKVLRVDSDPEYVFEYDINKTLDEQNVLKQTKIIIALFFRDYWATEQQKEKIINYENTYRYKKEQEKQAYNSNELFNNRKKNVNNNYKSNQEDLALVEIKEEKLYKRIIAFIKKIFNRKDK